LQEDASFADVLYRIGQESVESAPLEYDGNAYADYYKRSPSRDIYGGFYAEEYTGPQGEQRADGTYAANPFVPSYTEPLAATFAPSDNSSSSGDDYGKYYDDKTSVLDKLLDKY
jgi:hypothetical protein